MSVPVIAPVHARPTTRFGSRARRWRTLLAVLAATLVGTVLVAPPASATPESQLAELTVRAADRQSHAPDRWICNRRTGSAVADPPMRAERRG